MKLIAVDNKLVHQLSFITLIKSLIPLGALVGAVVASPSAHLYKRQAGLESFIQQEQTIAKQGVLNNIGSDGKLVQGASAGVVVASPSKQNPNYFYTWTRDAALTIIALTEQFFAGDSSLEPLIQRYISGQAKLQTVSNPSGNLANGSGLGEPTFNVNLTAFTGAWGRPQSDGPPLRATALIKYGNYLIENGKKEEALNNIWPIVKNDLSYSGQYWNESSIDLWEEVKSSSFFTTAAFHRALVEGQRFATTLGQTCTGCSVAPAILCHLQEYWNGTAIVSNLPTSGRSGLDINSVLSSIQTFDPAASCEDATFQPCSPRALSNHKVLVDSFRPIYGVNKGRASGKAVAVGRYPEDVYQGGNPWYLSNFAAAEQLYDALYQWDKQGVLTVTKLSAPFFKDLVSNVTTGSYPKSSPTYKTITSAVKNYADGFISVVQQYIPSNGTMSEQYDRNTGTPLSANNLTWSYASFLTAAARRVGNVPASWGSTAAKAVPSKCAAATVSGSYAAPTTGSW